MHGLVVHVAVPVRCGAVCVCGVHASIHLVRACVRLAAMPCHAMPGVAAVYLPAMHAMRAPGDSCIITGFPSGEGVRE